MKKLPRKITLKQLVALCFKEPSLFKKLCKNPQRALAALDLFLDPNDLALLTARIADLKPEEIDLIRWVFENLSPSRRKADPKKPPLWP